MKVTPVPAIPDLQVIEPDIFGDHRGYFLETYRESRYEEAGITTHFVQDNLSFSRRGILRGLHFQLERPQAKLVSVAAGEVYDVAVDVRRGSPTFGQWHGVLLSAENHRQFFIPEGFAHGFCVRSETALFTYKCSDMYDPASERGIRWDDPALAIDWSITDPSISAKDAVYPFLDNMDEVDLPIYTGACE